MDSSNPASGVQLFGGGLPGAAVSAVAIFGPIYLGVVIPCGGIRHRHDLRVRALLVIGADTHRIAEQMFLSENTVQDHLKSIFVKTATRNRRTLLARAVGG